MFGMRISIALLVALTLLVEVVAAPGEGYYQPAEGKRGTELREALHKVIANHKVVSYDNLWVAYQKTDVTADGKPFCIYSGFPFEDFRKNPGGRPGKIGSFLTREHSWPKDWWGGTRNHAYSDLFHVILGDAHVNGQKGVKPLGEVASDGRTFGISKAGPARDGLGYSGEVFEPADEFKGDFARNYLYFATRYLSGTTPLDCTISPMVAADGVTLKPWAIRLLLKWHRSDPVSAREIHRNDAVFEFQGNRNPFIDHPEFADRIWSDPLPPALLTGADANYVLEMEARERTWEWQAKRADLFPILNDAGFDAFRVRVWTGDEGPNGLHYATNVMQRARKHGLKLYAVLFLSEDWSDYVKQPAPAIWRKLSFEQKVQAVESYAERTARHFSDQGLTVDYFEIGNEIDFGICGEFEEEWSRRTNLDHMKTAIWPKMAAIIRAAQAGVKKVQPRAKFTLHLTQWWNPDYCGSFFKAMIGSGVTVDFCGVSFFPTSGLSKENSLDFFSAQMKKLHVAVRRPVWICETGYPSEPSFPGQFADWNKPVEGYTLDESGQARWIRDFLKRSADLGFVDGVFYWSPEWYDSDMWSAFALFDVYGRPKEALRTMVPSADTP